MRFEPLYHRDRMRLINPYGDVGVVTLWSKVDSVYQVLTTVGINLDPETSRVAVIANLYGNGLPHMLRNLLWNPQIRHIVILGANLSGSREWLLNFFQNGLEEVEFLGVKVFRIRGTNHIIDGEVRPEDFVSPPKFDVYGERLGGLEVGQSLKSFFNSLPILDLVEKKRFEPPPIPEPNVTRFPSDPRGQTIIRATPMEAWSELIFRLYRFGHRNTITKSTGDETRVELQNVKVVVNNPVEENDDCLKKYGFSLDHFQEYQRKILDPENPADISYTYGNRLRAYFQHNGEFVDSLKIVGEHLKKNPDSRHEYITLWDGNRDLSVGKGCPCFVSAFFRRFECKLTLTATFRTHNAMNAWPENFYGLMAIQNFVAEIAGMEIGPITVFSHSISIDPSALEMAKQIAESKTTDMVVDSITDKTELRFDPNGEFVVTFDRNSWEIVVEHSFDGMKIHEYRGKTAEEVEMQLSRDIALSEISHALYIGREIARAEIKMKSEKK